MLIVTSTQHIGSSTLVPPLRRKVNNDRFDDNPVLGVHLGELVTRLAIKTEDQVLLPTGPAVRHQRSQPEWDFVPGWSLAVQDHRDNPVILFAISNLSQKTSVNF